MWLEDDIQDILGRWFVGLPLLLLLFGLELLLPFYAYQVDKPDFHSKVNWTLLVLFLEAVMVILQLWIRECINEYRPPQPASGIISDFASLSQKKTYAPKDIESYKNPFIGIWSTEDHGTEFSFETGGRGVKRRSTTPTGRPCPVVVSEFTWTHSKKVCSITYSDGKYKTFVDLDGIIVGRTLYLLRASILPPDPAKLGDGAIPLYRRRIRPKEPTRPKEEIPLDQAVAEAEGKILKIRSKLAKYQDRKLATQQLTAKRKAAIQKVSKKYKLSPEEVSRLIRRLEIDAL